MKCLKCGAENHPDQRVCVQCGALTPKAGGFFYNQQKAAWRPTKKQIKYGVGALISIIVLVVLINVLTVTPPDVVADEWFSAMAERRLGDANDYITEEFSKDLGGRMMDLRALSDQYYTDIVNERATYSLDEVVMGPDEKSAHVDVVVRYPDGGGRKVEIKLVKDGRAWKINEVH